MNYISCYTTLSILFLLNINEAKAQADVHQSQFNENAILRNPALTGVNASDFKFMASYRSQWATIGNPYTTMALSGVTKTQLNPYKEDMFSIGVHVFTDNAGAANQKITGIYPAINYNKSLNPDYNSFLSVGIVAGYAQYSFNPSKITYNNQYDNGIFNTSIPNLENFSGTKLSYWDVGAGLNFNTSNNTDNTIVYSIGVSGYHLNQPSFSYNTTNKIKINVRANINASADVAINDFNSIQIHTNYGQQGEYKEIICALLWQYNFKDQFSKTDFSLTLGSGYRYNDAIMPIVKIKYNKIGAGVSYDINTSSFQKATNSNGGLEISLFYVGDYNSGPIAPGKKVCPRF